MDKRQHSAVYLFEQIPFGENKINVEHISHFLFYATSMLSTLHILLKAQK